MAEKVKGKTTGKATAKGGETDSPQAKPVARKRKPPVKGKKPVTKAAKPAAKKAAPFAKEATVVASRPTPGASVPIPRWLAPFEEMERWFEEALNRPFFAPAWLPRLRFPDIAGELAPSVDIYEEGLDVVVKAEVPGIRREDIEVNLSGDLLTISGTKRAEEKVERKDFHRVERSYGSFTRRLKIPVETQTDKAKASFKDGVLEIRIPKTVAAASKGRKVTVS